MRETPRMEALHEAQEGRWARGRLGTLSATTPMPSASCPERQRPSSRGHRQLNAGTAHHSIRPYVSCFCK